MKGRSVYSTEKGRICPKCGWPAQECRCSTSLAAEEPVPAKITVRLFVQNTGPGKKVTVIDGLPRNPGFLAGLAKELKKSCGTGGKAGEDSVELQGDQREHLHELLSRKGWIIRG
jgi:translation initiation factor 1